MKTRQDYFRAEGLLKSDRAVMSEGCKALVLQDVGEKLGEFFALSSPLEMAIEKVGDEYRVTISFQAESIKKFNVLR